ncbi:MAG: HD domain-containing protein [Nitrospirota bacterium]|nr:HD domain-containing protein [Nitrospirota bacterium]
MEDGGRRVIRGAGADHDRVITQQPYPAAIVSMTIDPIVVWARSTAEEMLGGLVDRWLHVAEVGSRALRIGTALTESDRTALAAAAYLHDIGYAPSIVVTGLHQLDGAVWLRAKGIEQRLCNLVAHHSAARYEAEERGRSAEMEWFELEEGPVPDLLVFLDMTTGPRGELVSLQHRLDDILRRYPGSDPVHRATVRAQSSLAASVQRSRQWLPTGMTYPT